MVWQRRSATGGSDGAAVLLDGLPKADWLLGDRGYDADWFRDALEEKAITPCIPGRKPQNKPVKCDKRRYKGRNKIEIMFGRLKDQRRVATRVRQLPDRLAICRRARRHRPVLAVSPESNKQ